MLQPNTKYILDLIKNRVYIINNMNLISLTFDLIKMPLKEKYERYRLALYM
jgi:hypothetical protein